MTRAGDGRAEPFTLIDDGRPVELSATIRGDRVCLSAEAAARGTGWRSAGEGEVDLQDLAQALDRPLALDLAERAAFLGVSARARGRALATLEAPDFTLPDLHGRLHTLSEHRGRKVLLVAYASW